MNRSEISLTAMFNLDAFEESNQTLQRQMKQSARQMKAIGQQMTMALSLPITLGLGAAVKEFATFELNMAKVKAVSGATEQEFEGLKNTAEELGRTTKFTAQEVADLELQYSKLGFSASEIQKITKATLDLALVTDEELGRSAMVAGSTLRGFNLEGEEMARVVDVMAASFTSSALDLEKWYVSTSKVAPIASVMNVSLEKVAAMQSVLADSGIEASIIGTQLRQIFGELAKSGLSYDEALSKISNSQRKTATAIKLFDKRAAAAAIILSEQADKVNRLEYEYYNAAGAAEEMGSVINDTLIIDLEKLRSAIQNVAIKFGQVLSPAIRGVSNTLTSLAGIIANLNPVTKLYIVTIAAFAAAVPPIISLMGSLAMANMRYSKSMSFAVKVTKRTFFWFTAIAAAVQTLSWTMRRQGDRYRDVEARQKDLNNALARTAYLKNLVNKTTDMSLQKAKDYAKSVEIETRAIIEANQAAIRLNKSKLQLAITEYMEIMSKSGNTFAGGFMTFTDIGRLKGLDEAISGYANLISELDAQNTIAEEELKRLDSILELKESGLNIKDIGDEAEKAAKKLKDLRYEYIMLGQEVYKLSDLGEQTGGFSEIRDYKDVGQSIVGSIVDGVKSSKGELQDAFEEALEALKKSDISSALEELKISFENNWKMTMVNGVSQLIGDFATGLGEMLSGAMTPKDFGREMLVQVASFIQQLGGLLIVYGAGMSALLTSMSAPNPATAVAAIAGGAAMVAAGAAIKGALSKGLDGGGGGMMGYGGSRATTGMGNQDFTSEIRIQGREMIIVQRREGSFRR